MLLWANNGDIISRQYAGTNALKGDYTRTGERKVSGMLKDGVNSANRLENFDIFDHPPPFKSSKTFLKLLKTSKDL